MPLEHRVCVTACLGPSLLGASLPHDSPRVLHRHEATGPCSFSGVRPYSPARSRARAMRAILFATATQALCTPTRPPSWRIHRLVAAVFVCTRLTTESTHLGSADQRVDPTARSRCRLRRGDNSPPGQRRNMSRRGCPGHSVCGSQPLSGVHLSKRADGQARHRGRTRATTRRPTRGSARPASHIT